MPKLIRLYIDSVLVGLVLALLLLCGLAMTDIGGVTRRILSPQEGHQVVAGIVIFAAGVFSSVLFAVNVVRVELAQDRAIERRKREGWGRSPRDRRRMDRRQNGRD